MLSEISFLFTPRRNWNNIFHGQRNIRRAYQSLELRNYEWRAPFAVSSPHLQVIGGRKGAYVGAVVDCLSVCLLQGKRNWIMRPGDRQTLATLFVPSQRRQRTSEVESPTYLLYFISFFPPHINSCALSCLLEIPRQDERINNAEIPPSHHTVNEWKLRLMFLCSKSINTRTPPPTSIASKWGTTGRDFHPLPMRIVFCW